MLAKTLPLGTKERVGDIPNDCSAADTILKPPAIFEHLITVEVGRNLGGAFGEFSALFVAHLTEEYTMKAIFFIALIATCWSFQMNNMKLNSLQSNSFGNLFAEIKA
jgi:hypothetical protein